MEVICNLESWGSGAKRIIAACRAQGIEEPVWSESNGFVTVTFKRSPVANIKVSIQTEGKKLSVRQQRILEIIKENPMVSLVEMAKRLEVSVSTVEREIPGMSEYLRHIGPKKRRFLTDCQLIILSPPRL